MFNFNVLRYDSLGMNNPVNAYQKSIYFVQMVKAIIWLIWYKKGWTWE